MKKLLPYIILISIPYICWLLGLVVSWGLIPAFIETIYFSPLSWFGEAYFKKIETGILVPTHLGRISGVLIYLVLLISSISLFKLFQKKHENN